MIHWVLKYAHMLYVHKQVRLQLEALLAEKSRLATENANLTRENQCLRQLVEYHQFTSQDLSASYEQVIQGLCLDFSSPVAEEQECGFWESWNPENKRIFWIQYWLWWGLCWGTRGAVQRLILPNFPSNGKYHCNKLNKMDTYIFCCLYWSIMCPICMLFSFKGFVMFRMHACTICQKQPCIRNHLAWQAWQRTDVSGNNHDI